MRERGSNGVGINPGRNAQVLKSSPEGRYVQGEGFTITRKGTDYIGLLEPSGSTRIRLKGGIYSEDRFDAVRASMGQQTPIPNRPDPDKAAKHAETLNRLTEVRARFNKQRYPLPAWEAESRATHPREGETLDAFLDRALGDLALHPTPEALAAAPSMQRRRERLEKVMSEPEAEAAEEIDLPRGHV
jgi:hypothetical protein